MMRLFAVLGLSLGLGWIGCSDTSEQDPFGCDRNAAGVHQCTDYALEAAGNGDLSAESTACTQSGGAIVSACDHTGAAGGCRTFHPDPNGGLGMNVTTWFYSPKTSADVMMLCDEGGYQFVSP
jgi:hypothetical protein